tara:strand:+ start:31349 stop:31534 length:186 start_codon:yes stop_codon:yes gene_type:complete
VIANHDYSCERYNTLWLVEKDFANIGKMRQDPEFKETIEKYTSYHTINEKQFFLCQLPKSQ